eukprot:GFKZ01015013.1.p1 GENE.GFKZ01015013.1~~GFKZ01015013.1.p1  ORF type:complete len:541 (+),score=58.01 GFKZ01015013.1:299-1921(+)
MPFIIAPPLRKCTDSSGPSKLPNRSRFVRNSYQCPRLSLADPNRPRNAPPDKPTYSDASHRPVEPQGKHDDYHGWSQDFIDLCTSQFSLLASTIPTLSQALLFFRRENPNTGALEFVPLVVHSPNFSTASRVWISSGSAAETALEPGSPSRVLPGGIPAEWILPDYPFKNVNAFGDSGAIVMPDGGLCLPVEYNGVLAGSIVLFSGGNPAPQWTEEDANRAAMVAKSIAMGAALEGKWSSAIGTVGASRQLIESMRALLRVTLHQVRSPVSALVTFGHLLLHKLPPGDENRKLAKNIIVEAFRVDDLLKPLDLAGESHVLPEASPPWYEHEDHHHLGFDTADAQESKPVPAVYADMMAEDVLQMLWLSDVLEPQVEVARALAEEKGLHFTSRIDDDMPAVFAIGKHVREAVSNLIDNSLKYTSPGGHVGLHCSVREIENDANGEPDEVVEVVVWDTGFGFSEDEKKYIFEYGFRGSAAEFTAVPGSGIGLSAVREMLQASGAEVSLESPLPDKLDPRKRADGKQDNPGSAFTLRFRRPSL